MTNIKKEITNKFQNLIIQNSKKTKQLLNNTAVETILKIQISLKNIRFAKINILIQNNPIKKTLSVRFLLRTANHFFLIFPLLFFKHKSREMGLLLTAERLNVCRKHI
jgi:hypothetical protein